ncbi:MAG: sugar nucleotide-binding protein, partial [Candidatus Xenobia bacterium]
RDPASVLGKALAQAEQVVEETCDDRLILRTSMLFGASAGRMGEWRQAWRENRPVLAPGDVVGTPTFVEWIPRIAVSLLRRDGLFHVAGSARRSMLDLATELAHALEVKPGLVRGELAEQHPERWGAPWEGGLAAEKVGRLPSLEEALQKLAYTTV